MSHCKLQLFQLSYLCVTRHRGSLRLDMVRQLKICTLILDMMFARDTRQSAVVENNTKLFTLRVLGSLYLTCTWHFLAIAQSLLFTY